MADTALELGKKDIMARSSVITAASDASEDMALRFIKIAVNLSAEKDLKKLMNLITREAMELASAAKGTLYLVDHENMKLMFYVTDQKHLNEAFVPLNPQSISGYVGVTGNLLLIDDVYELADDSPYKFNKSFDMASGFRTKSMLVIPLFSHKNEILGVLQLINKTCDGNILGFNEDDLRVIQAVGSLAAVSIENTLLYREIESLFESFVRYSATAIDERDPCTGGHSRRVAEYSVKLAEALGGFTPDQLKEISYASWLHDLGKIGVREAVLNKANKLTASELDAFKNRLRAIAGRVAADAYEFVIKIMGEGLTAASLEVVEIMAGVTNYRAEVEEDIKFIEQINIPGFLSDDKAKRLSEIYAKKYIDASGAEWGFMTAEEFENLAVVRGNLTTAERIEMESHASKTYDILRHIPFTRDLKNVPDIAGRHHEKLDGTGYPAKLKSDDIPVQSKIIAIVDVFDALTARDRPYKKAMPTEVALKILREEAAAGKIDSAILGVFIEKEVYKAAEK